MESEQDVVGIKGSSFHSPAGDAPLWILKEEEEEGSMRKEDLMDSCRSMELRFRCISRYIQMKNIFALSSMDTVFSIKIHL